MGFREPCRPPEMYTLLVALYVAGRKLKLFSYSNQKWPRDSVIIRNGPAEKKYTRISLLLLTSGSSRAISVFSLLEAFCTPKNKLFLFLLHRLFEKEASLSWWSRRTFLPQWEWTVWFWHFSSKQVGCQDQSGLNVIIYMGFRILLGMTGGSEWHSASPPASKKIFR